MLTQAMTETNLMYYSLSILKLTWDLTVVCACLYDTCMLRPNKKNCLVVLQWPKKIGSVGRIFFFFLNTALWKQKGKASNRQWLMFKVVTWC